MCCNTPFLSIVIPAYNESLRLPSTLDKIEQYLIKRQYDAEVIIVIEKSTDKTLEVVQSYTNKFSNIKYIKNEEKMGKGYSVKRGVLEAKGKYVLFTDADLSTPIEEMSKMLAFLKTNFDCCIGDRIQIEKQPLYRIIMGISFRWISKMIIKLPYRDSQCGFKMFNNKFGKEVFSKMTINGFAFDIEMLMIAKKLKYKVKPLKVKWFNDKNSKVKPIKDSLQMLRDLFIIRIKVLKMDIDKK